MNYNYFGDTAVTKRQITRFDRQLDLDFANFLLKSFLCDYLGLPDTLRRRFDQNSR